MKKVNQGKAAGIHQSNDYLDRIVTLTNRIHRNQLRCLQEAREITKRTKSIQVDIDTIALEVARQAGQAK